jgi:hypothetical protein
MSPNIESEKVMTKLVSLIRQVPWGPSRAELEARSSALRNRAIYERGMCDNHFTANKLHEEADLYLFAAQARFPREGDTMVAAFVAKVRRSLRLRKVSLS